MNLIVQYLSEIGLTINVNKSNYIIFNHMRRKEDLNMNIYVGEEKLTIVEDTKFLGVFIDKHLKFEKHIHQICQNISKSIFAFRRMSSYRNEHTLLNLYYGLIFSQISYGIIIWGNSSSCIKQIFTLQKMSLRTIFNKPKRFSCKNIFKDNKIMTLTSIYIYESILFQNKFNSKLYNASISKKLNNTNTKSFYIFL